MECLSKTYGTGFIVNDVTSEAKKKASLDSVRDGDLVRDLFSPLRLGG